MRRRHPPATGVRTSAHTRPRRLHREARDAESEQQQDGTFELLYITMLRTFSSDIVIMKLNIKPNTYHILFYYTIFYQAVKSNITRVLISVFVISFFFSNYNFNFILFKTS